MPNFRVHSTYSRPQFGQFSTRPLQDSKTLTKLSGDTYDNVSHLQNELGWPLVLPSDSLSLHKAKEKEVAGQSVSGVRQVLHWLLDCIDA
jgi:hypothetical protein